MKIYVVLKEGVYLQDAIGVFDDEKLALKALYKSKEEEPDDYHDFFIITGELNKSLDFGNETFRLAEEVVEQPISQDFIDKLMAGV